MALAAFDFDVVKLGIYTGPYDIILCSGVLKRECIEYTQSKDIFNKVFYYSNIQHRNAMLEMYNNNSTDDFMITKLFCSNEKIPNIDTYIITEETL